MARRSPRGVTLVQVVLVVCLIAMAVGGMTYALYGQLGPLFGTADTTLAGNEKTSAADKQQNQVMGKPASADPNALQNSMQQNANQNTAAAAKATGTP
jgi:hypothetical protein